MAAARDPDAPGLAAEAADALALTAAERLCEHADWAPLRQRLAAQDPEGAARFGRLLQLSPTLRTVSTRARELSRTGAGAHAPALRIAFRDAEAATPGGGPLLLAALAAQLDQPWKALRLVSAVMDKPTDTYLAQSELAGFGLALLDDIDARLAELRAFDGAGGADAGRAAGGSALACAQEILELEQGLSMKRDGPWGRRTALQKRELAEVGEKGLRQAVSAVNQALPVGPARLKGRVRGMPRLDAPLEALAARRALGLLAFVDATRSAAGASGFGSARAKAVEELDGRLDQYVEDLLELLHGEEPTDPAADLRARLDLAAECLAMVREPRAAELVRRRAAAA